MCSFWTSPHTRFFYVKAPNQCRQSVSRIPRKLPRSITACLSHWSIHSGSFEISKRESRA
jgi:hypothetical protein